MLGGVNKLLWALYIFNLLVFEGFLAGGVFNVFEAYICNHKQTCLNCTIQPRVAHVTQNNPMCPLGTEVFKELCMELLEIFCNTEGDCDIPCFPIYCPLSTWKHRGITWITLSCLSSHMHSCVLCRLIHREISRTINIFSMVSFVDFGWGWLFCLCRESGLCLMFLGRRFFHRLFVVFIVSFGSSIKSWVCLQTKNSHV